MSSRGWPSAILAAAVLVGVAALFYFLRPQKPVGPALRSGPEFPAPTAVAASTPLPEPRVAVASVSGEEPPSRLADELNAPGGNIRRDLEIVSELIVAWQTNFPRLGNPVGENAEIVAALTGDNPLKNAFIPRNHRAISGRGELCDRWGTPFRFHQVSADNMELQSAGPDRKFATADDAFWPPDRTP